MLEFQLSIQKYALRLEPHDSTILDDCLALADDIVRQTEMIDAAGGLRWLPDLPMTGATALAQFFVEVSIATGNADIRLCGACQHVSNSWWRVSSKG
jgi:hypothetical protein